MKKNSVKKFKKTISDWLEKEDKTVVYNASNLKNFLQILYYYDVNLLGNYFVINLSKFYPELLKKHLHLFKDFNHFSFLTPEIAVELFKDRNHLANPFSLKKLVQTVDLEVIIALLDLWDYELKRNDIEFIFENWSQNPIFMARIDNDPRSWLLWKKLSIIKRIPIENLLICIEINRSIVKYTNLILAIIHHTEVVNFESFYSLEYIYADLHKNEVYEFTYFSPEYVSVLSLEKNTFWFEKVDFYMKEISLMMNIKRLLINKLAEFMSDHTTIDPVEFSIIDDLLVLLKVQLINLNQLAFVQSLDYEIVNEILGSFVLKSSDFCPTVMSWQVGKLDSWIFLWNYLRNYGLIDVYDRMAAINFDETTILIDLLTNINNNVNKKQVRRTYWHIPLAVKFFKKSADINESDICLNALISFMKNQSCELLHDDFYRICRHLAPESLDKYLPYIENFDCYLEIFKLAPEMMTRDQIKYILGNQNLYEFALFHGENFMKLNTLVDFMGFNLLKFFSVASDYHLELHEALHTARPEALIDYLIGINGALNYPEQFLFSVHHNAWKHPKFIDLIIYSIPFTFFLKYPSVIKKKFKNLCDSIVSVRGSDSFKCAETSFDFKKNNIIKWLIHMEWIFVQFHVIKFLNPTQIEEIENNYDNFLKIEKISRIRIVKWLSRQSFIDEDREHLIEIVESLPLSFVRLSTCYNYYFSSLICPHNFNLCNIFDQFYKFDCKSILEINLSNLEQTLQINLDICKDLIEKYFDPIEKEIWLSRLNISNFISINQFDLHSEVSINFLNLIFKDRKILSHESQVAFDILSYLGFDNQLIEGIENEFLEPLKTKVIKN